MNVRLLYRDPRVLLRVLHGCYVGGRRRRPGEHVVALADEARLLVGDGVAELLPDRVKPAPAAPESPPRPPLAA